MGSISGVYEIRNKTNNKIYIGSSARGLNLRWNEHRYLLHIGQHHSQHLQNAWDLYGSDTFEFNVLISCHPSLCIWHEQQFLDQQQPEYNTATEAKSRYGVKASEATKEKLRGRICWCKGKKLGPMPEEQRQRISATMKQKWADGSMTGSTGRIPWNKGIPRSEETKRKISRATEGKTHDRTGHKGFLGKKHTDETKRKMSKTQKDRWARRKMHVC